MSTKSRPKELIQEALDGSLLPLGGYSLRDSPSSTLRIGYPKQAVDFNSVEPGDEMRMWIDQETGAVVTIPADQIHD